MMKCLLISPLNCIWNINFLLYSFLKYRDFKFFVMSILVVVKERIVYSKCISCYFLVIFCVLIRAISERVSQSFNIYNASPFLFCRFESINLSINLSIYQSIYLSTYWQLYEVICPTFLKAVLSAKQYHLSKLFIMKFRFKQSLYANFIGLCRYVLSSKIVELDSQNLHFVPMF